MDGKIPDLCPILLHARAPKHKHDAELMNPYATKYMKQRAEAPSTGVTERQRQYLAVAVRAAHGGDGEEPGAGGRPPDLVRGHAGRPGAEGAQRPTLGRIPQDDLAVLP